MTNPEQLKLHKISSYVKSVIRIDGAWFGIFAYWDHRLGLMAWAFALIGIAEILGIIEEMVVE